MPSTLTLSLPDELRAFVDAQTRGDGLYSTPSEYIRDLIRREHEHYGPSDFRQGIIEGYHDLAEGNYSKYTGMEEILAGAAKQKNRQKPKTNKK